MGASDLRADGGGGGGGVARDSNTPRTYGRRGWGYARDRNTPRTYDRRGCLKKEDKYASGLDAGQGIEKPDSPA